LALRLVLDTNVWLDWLVFADASVAPIKSAVTSMQAEIFIDEACAAELAAVLAYPLRKEILDPEARAALLTECQRIVCPHPDPPPLREGGNALDRLPVCRDPDDQKFLELAIACRADFLVTKDLMLLELARRKVRRTPFRIVTPAQLTAELMVAPGDFNSNSQRRGRRGR
jgi:putative PIN family toxin of toxin-antitoxin system